MLKKFRAPTQSIWDVSAPKLAGIQVRVTPRPDTAPPLDELVDDATPGDDARFRDRTMTWFRAGDELENEKESDDYEPFRASRIGLIALTLLVGAAALAAAGAVILG